jgi:hypothetical protein
MKIKEKSKKKIFRFLIQGHSCENKKKKKKKNKKKKKKKKQKF